MNGEVSNFKIEQDTIRILINKLVANGQKFPIDHSYHPAQITFVLNNYNNLETLLQQKGKLQSYIDTMAIASRPKKEVDPYSYKTTLYYHPFDTGTAFAMERKLLLYTRDVEQEAKNNIAGFYSYQPKFSVNLDIGAGLIRDKIGTLGELGLQYVFHQSRNDNYRNIVCLSVSPYLLFEKNTAGQYGTNDNWFVNAEVGTVIKNSTSMVKREVIGIGYLLKPNGPYFQKNTYKLYFNFTFKNDIVIAPEVYFTDNFHSVFPGITVKGFLNRDLD